MTCKALVSNRSYSCVNEYIRAIIRLVDYYLNFEYSFAFEDRKGAISNTILSNVTAHLQNPNEPAEDAFLMYLTRIEGLAQTLRLSRFTTNSHLIEAVMSPCLLVDENFMAMNSQVVCLHRFLLVVSYMPSRLDGCLFSSSNLRFPRRMLTPTPPAT